MFTTEVVNYLGINSGEKVMTGIAPITAPEEYLKANLIDK